MSKNSQRLQALRDRGEAMYREGQADGKLGVAHRYVRQDTQFNRYNIGYKHGWSKAGHTAMRRRKPLSLWQRFLKLFK